MSDICTWPYCSHTAKDQCKWEDQALRWQAHIEARSADPDEIITLRAENERLRAALTKIGRYEVPPVPVPWTHAVAADTYWIGIDYMRHTARAALKENSDE